MHLQQIFHFRSTLLHRATEGEGWGGGTRRLPKPLISIYVWDGAEKGDKKKWRVHPNETNPSKLIKSGASKQLKHLDRQQMSAGSEAVGPTGDCKQLNSPKNCFFFSCFCKIPASPPQPVDSWLFPSFFGRGGGAGRRYPFACERLRYHFKATHPAPS